MSTSAPDPLDIALAGLKAAVIKLPLKTQSIITDWIIRWSNLLIREKMFNPEYLTYFKRGDIVYVDLGFNVGSEHGGIHYAAIYEHNNSKKNKNVGNSSAFQLFNIKKQCKREMIKFRETIKIPAASRGVLGNYWQLSE